MPIKHQFESAVVDDADPDKVGPDEWNDDHTVDGAEDIPFDNTASGLVATDTKSAIDELAALVLPNFGPGLAATYVGATDSGGGLTITLTKPGGTTDGDLVILCVSGHNVVPNAAGPASGGGAWTERLRFDTDGNEWIAIYTKVAASEGASWSITTNSSSATLSSATVVVLRGPTTFVRSSYSDGTLVSGSPDGSPNGHEIIVWMSALAAGTLFSISDPDITQHHAYRVTSGEGAYMVASRPTTNAFPQAQFTASASGISGTWLGNLAMIWE